MWFKKKEKKLYDYQFALSFIEELLQNGASSFDKKDKHFVLKEYPYYNSQATKEMHFLHKWWLEGSDKLETYKDETISKLPPEIASSIISKPWVRFFILKTFHDSMITGMSLDNKTLRIEIAYDDAFCKTQFGKQILLTFYEAEKCSDELKEIIDYANRLGIRIQSLEYSFENGNDIYKLDLACEWNEEKFIPESKYWGLNIQCEKVEIEKLYRY